MALFAACQGDPQPTADTPIQVEDSAGIRVIENAQPMEGSRVWRVGPEPAVSIGAGEGEDPYMLYRVIDATKLSDGGIVIANSGDGQLRVFDARGTHVATSGGEGEGPGEFRSLEQVEPWPGDSIAAWYGPRLGISIFDFEGNFGRNFTLVRNPDDPNSLTLRPAGGDGRWRDPGRTGHAHQRQGGGRDPGRGGQASQFAWTTHR